MNNTGIKSGGRQKGTPNKATAELREIFQKHGRFFAAALLKLARSTDQNVSLKAIALCLDRGWGKAPQPLVGADGEGPVLTRIERIIIDNRPGESPEPGPDVPRITH